MSRFSNFVSAPRRVVESLVEPDSNPDPQGYTHSSKTVHRGDFDVERPQDELDDYWRLYETNPLISQPIDHLASKVVEAGWYFEADSDETVEELTEFAENCAIVKGEPKQSVSDLIAQAVIQHQVKGTFLAEKVTTGDGKPQALNPLQPNTFELYTKPGSNILLQPDDTDKDNVKLTKDGRAAAYVQFDANDPRWERKEKRFARDEIIKWSRGNEVGEAFGTSRVERVYERALALEAKLRDNDDAIAMKAWPMVLFEMGSEDDPWRDHEIDDFLEDFDAENFGPGLMKAVSGDVSIEEFAGETADIEHAVETDVNFIISGMPGPKYALGSFAQDLGKNVAAVQERQYKKLVRHLRQELEEKLTPYFRDVAEAYGLDSPNSVEFNLSRPSGEVAPEDVNGNLIQYTSDAGTGEGQGQGGQNQPKDADGDGVVGEGSGNPQPAPKSRSGVPAGLSETTELDLVPDGADELLESLDLDGRPVEEAELSDPRLVSTSDLESELTTAMLEAFLQARDQTLERALEVYDSPADASGNRIENSAQTALNDAVSQHDVDTLARENLRSVAERTIETMGQENHDPQFTVAFQNRHSMVVERNVSDLFDDIDAVADNFSRSMRHQLARVRQSDESLETWAERVRNDVDRSLLRESARLKAHMKAQSIVNEIKLTEYEQRDGVAGVRVINPCTQNTTRLCRDLAGCAGGEPATAWFDSEQSIGQQLEEQVEDEFTFEGFRPIPSAPPWHFGCRSEFVPVAGSDR